jgi:hypothetical protein
MRAYYKKNAYKQNRKEIFMRQTICCLIFYLTSFILQPGLSFAAPQSLAGIFESGSVNFTRDRVISEKEFPEEVYFQNPRGIVVHTDGRITLGCSDLYDIEVHDPDLGRLFSFSHEYAPVKIIDEDKNNHFSIFTISIFRGNKKETKQGAPDYIKDNTTFPKYKPAFKDIVTDDEGNIWVRPFHEDRGLEDRLFDVFDKKGQFIKRIRVFGKATFPSSRTSKIDNKVFWEIEKVDEEFFRIVRNKIGE